MPQGLDLFIEPSSKALAGIAHSATLFHVAWFLFLVVALRRVASLSRGTAIAIAVTVFVLTIGLGALRGGLTG